MDAWDEIAAVGRMTDFFLKFIASLPRDELCIWMVGLGRSNDTVVTIGNLLV